MAAEASWEPREQLGCCPGLELPAGLCCDVRAHPSHGVSGLDGQRVRVTTWKHDADVR